MFPQLGAVFHHPSTRPFISSMSPAFGGSELEELSRQKCPGVVRSCFETCASHLSHLNIKAEQSSFHLEVKPQFLSFSALVGTFGEEPSWLLMLGPASTDDQAAHRNGISQVKASWKHRKGENSPQGVFLQDKCSHLFLGLSAFVLGSIKTHQMVNKPAFLMFVPINVPQTRRS